MYGLKKGRKNIKSSLVDTLTLPMGPVRRLDSAILRIAIFSDFLKQLVNRSDLGQTSVF